MITLLLGIHGSCQDLEKRPLSGEFTSEVETDTSLWLKETRGIRDILEDGHGNLWFSSPGYVAKFDGNDLHYFSENDGLHITGNLHKDSGGTLWIEDGFRAFRYDGRRFFEERIDSITGANGLWLQRGLSPADTAFAEPGLYEANNETTLFHPLPVKENADNRYLYLPTTKASFGKDSTVWIGTMEKVYGFRDNSFISIGREEMGRQDDERQMGIRGIFVDGQGNLWIADNGAGVFVFDGKETENFSRKHHLDEGSDGGNTLHRAFSIAEGPEGRMWFGTVYSGIWSYNPKTKAFKNYTADDGVSSEVIWMIYKTVEGELLFAGESPAAVYKFNGEVFDRIF